MNILGILQFDHRRFFAALDELDGRVSNSENKYYTNGFSGDVGKAAMEVLEKLLPEIERHEEVEEGLLFPEILRWAPGSERELEGMAREHGGMEGMLCLFMEELPKFADRPMNRVLLDLLHLANALRSHILREETTLYVLAEKSIPPAELERLGQEAERMFARQE